MAADAWVFFNKFKLHMADGRMSLSTHNFKMCLLDGTWTPDVTKEKYSDVSAKEVADGNGYSAGGVSVGVGQWTEATATCTFDSADGQWNNTGAGNLVSRYAVIYDDDDVVTPKALVCYSLLDNTPANVIVTPGNVFTIQISTSGVFSLT